MFQLNDVAGLKIWSDHLGEDPLMFGVIAVGEEGLAIVERTHHREVVGRRGESDIGSAQVVVDAVETGDKSAQSISDLTVGEVVIEPLKSHYMGEGHGLYCREARRQRRGCDDGSMTATLVAKGVAGGFAHRTLFEGVDLTVAPGDVIGVVGANGAGKSTLLRILAGDVEPLEGTVSAAPADAFVGWLPQEHQRVPGETVAVHRAAHRVHRGDSCHGCRGLGVSGPSPGSNRRGSGRRLRRGIGALARHRRS